MKGDPALPLLSSAYLCLSRSYNIVLWSSPHLPHPFLFPSFGSKFGVSGLGVIITFHLPAGHVVPPTSPIHPSHVQIPKPRWAASPSHSELSGPCSPFLLCIPCTPLASSELLLEFCIFICPQRALPIPSLPAFPAGSKPDTEDPRPGACHGLPIPSPGAFAPVGSSAGGGGGGQALPSHGHKPHPVLQHSAPKPPLLGRWL